MGVKREKLREKSEELRDKSVVFLKKHHNWKYFVKIFAYVKKKL